MFFFLLFSLFKVDDVKVLSSSVDPELILTVAGLSAGTEITEDKIRNAIKRLYNMELFSQVSLDTIREGKRLVLYIKVEEYPKLLKLNIRGNRRIKTKDIIKKINLKEGDVLSEQKVFNAKKEIKKMYNEKGYILAEVNVERIKKDEGVILNINITEGKNVRIKDVIINGAKNIKESKIKSLMQNKPKGPWYISWIIRKGRFDRKKFKEDLKKIENFYKNHGYLDAKIKKYELKYDTAGWLTIVIDIEEGKRYYTGNIKFKGNNVFSTPQLLRRVKLKKGKPFSLKDREVSIMEIFNLYADSGYIYVQVNPWEDKRKDTIDITFEITENTPARIRRIKIKGNEITHEKVIRREIVLLPGETFNRALLIRSQRNIYNLGFFEDVKVNYETVDSLGSIDLIFEVKEKMAGQLQVGASFSPQEGVVGNVDIAHPNLFGRGQSIYLHLEKGGRRTQAQLGFTEPWLFDTPTTVGFDLYYLTRYYDFYIKKDAGGALRGAKPLILDYTKGYITLTVENVYLDTLSGIPDMGPYTVRPEDYPKRIISFRFDFIRDSRDYFINPSKGTYLMFSEEMAPRVFFADVGYHREKLDFKGYFPIFWKFVGVGKFLTGYVGGFSKYDTVPIFERFFPGGTSYDGMLRGYPDRSIGVHYKGYNVGGNVMMIVSTEIKLMISKSLAFLVFFDAGNAWESLSDVNLSDLKKGVGPGVRVEIPLLGIVGFDLGYSINNKKFEPHFQLGRTF